MAGQCATASTAPAASGPKASPTPNVVPSKLITRLRAAPWNKGDSEDMAAANAAAPPRPCTKRSAAIKGTDDALAMATVTRQNTLKPASHTRRLPSRSVRLPATIMALP